LFYEIILKNAKTDITRFSKII